MMKAKDLQDQTINELEATLSDNRRKLFDMINEKRQAKKAEKPHLIKETKKDIARMLTVIRSKQLASLN
jgi:large subunit ribosomal protein L29